MPSSQPGRPCRLSRFWPGCGKGSSAWRHVKPGSEHKATTRCSITDREFAAALATDQAEAETEVRAQAVRYVPDRDAIEVLTTRHVEFLIPRGWIGALQDVPVEELAKLEVWPDGSAIELEGRDIHISVHGLLAAVLPAMLPMAAVPLFTTNLCCM